MTHFDLFSGYGGFTLALENIYGNNRAVLQKSSAESLSEIQSEPACRPSRTIGFSEIDKYASAVLKYHWPNIKNYGDITKIDWSEVPDFDLLTGGSPCQDLSIAGKRGGLQGNRSGLFFEYVRALKEKKPRFFVWENVKGALSSEKGWDFAAVLTELAEAGYSLWWQVLNAKDFGVPQNRERIFVVGFRDGSHREIFFERGTTEENNGQLCPTIRATHYKSGDNQPVIKQLNNPTHSNNRLYGDDGISPCLNTAQGGNRQPKIFDDYNHRFRNDDICGTVRQTFNNKASGNGCKLFDNYKIRRLTPTECERLMGLPDGWTAYGSDGEKTFDISDTQRYKLCGNGVVVNVVEEIIKTVILGN